MNFRTATTSLFLFAASPLMAGVPTTDGGAIAQLSSIIAETKVQIKEMIQTNIKLDDQTLKLIEQLEEAKRIYAALSDGLSLSDLGINADFLEEMFPDLVELSDSLGAAIDGDWQSVLNSGGTVGGKSVTDYVTGIFASAGLEKKTVDEMAKSDDPATARIATGANTGAFLSVAAETSAQEAKESLERVDQLVRQIPETDNLKKALDLNTRVTAELAVALANVWQMEAAQTIGQGQAGVMDAATLADEVKYLDLNGDGK